MTIKESLEMIWNLAGSPGWRSERRWRIESLARDAFRQLEEIKQEEQTLEQQRRMKPVRTMEELVKEVMEVQYACNLSGVIHSWAEAISDLRQNLPNAGTEEINRHPINVLWADKVAQLAGRSNGRVDKAYSELRELYKE